MAADPTDCAWLISLPGNPKLLNLQLKPGNIHGLLLGRARDCDLRLPAEVEEVSRRHARILHQSGRWLMVDLGSLWGTRVNGVAIPPNHPVPVGNGDLIYVHPWAFRFSASPQPPASRSVNDTGVTRFRTLTAESSEALREDLLNLLLEGAAVLAAAETEHSLAARLVDIASRGSGLNAAVLRSMDAQGGIDIIAPESARFPRQQDSMRFSRTLLTAASKGVVAEYSPDAGAEPSQTMVQSNVVSAICAPLMIGPAVYAYLYVQGARPPRSGASGFCQALSRLGGLAMANLRRIEVERHAADWRAELRTAAATQSIILPQSPITAGPYVCHGRSQPGDKYLGGDFFDVHVLSGGRLAVSLGDVSGHGVQASVLMAFAQGFLRAALAEHGDLVRAATGLNQFVADHSHPSQFITLWLGLLDPAAMTLTYIDAGHGLAHLIRADNQWLVLNDLGGPLIGIAPDSQYAPATLALAPDERLLIISDGIIEQRRPDLGPEDNRVQFGFERVRAALHNVDCNCMVDRLFDAVKHFAGSTDLIDDTTALLVHW